MSDHYYAAKCHACGHEWTEPVSESTLAQHEQRRHDGAQTCWLRWAWLREGPMSTHTRPAAKEGR